jgi:hypothetical protein
MPMKTIAKVIVGICIFLVVSILALSKMKDGTEITLIAMHEMLACEDCNHMIVINSTNKNIIGHSIIPISSEIKIDEVVNTALKSPMKKVCLKSRKYVLDLPFNFIKPGGIRFHIDEFSSTEECQHIVD